jgi:hypothetical protein
MGKTIFTCVYIEKKIKIVSKNQEEEKFFTQKPPNRVQNLVC